MTSTPTRKIKVLFADDHPVYRKGLTAILHAIPHVEVVGVAATGEEAIQLAESVQPDIILMDIGMPEKNGIEATREIALQHPQIGIIMLTMFDDDHSVFSAMRHGAKGYLLKGVDKEEIERAINSVAHGEAIFGPNIATRMMAYFDSLFTQFQVENVPDLTNREREILELIARGFENDEIAVRLDLNVKTVRNYVSIILNKLQVVDRKQASLMASQMGIVWGSRLNG
ncbi:MAG: response regulator transcription factor [Clostridia bacterium]